MGQEGWNDPGSLNTESTLDYPRIALGLPRVTPDWPRMTPDYPRSPLGYPRIALGLLQIALGLPPQDYSAGIASLGFLPPESVGAGGLPPEAEATALWLSWLPWLSWLSPRD